MSVAHKYLDMSRGPTTDPMPRAEGSFRNKDKGRNARSALGLQEIRKGSEMPDTCDGFRLGPRHLKVADNECPLACHASMSLWEKVWCPEKEVKGRQGVPATARVSGRDDEGHSGMSSQRVAHLP